MKILEVILLGRNKLKESKIDSYNLDARILLQYALSISHEELVMYPCRILDSDQQILYFDLIDRRRAYEPIAYIINQKEFFGLQFFVDKSVLIPRPETEILLESVISNVNKSSGKFLELGSGSGCISISLLKHYKNYTALSVDISDDAIFIAKKNAELHNISDRLSVINSDWFSSLEEEKFDFIISNPPYISYENEKNYMSKETLLHEPANALYADQNGYDSYMQIAKGADRYLIFGGKIFLEIGIGQRDIITKIFEQQGFFYHSQSKDLAGIVRCMVFSKKE